MLEVKVQHLGAVQFEAKAGRNTVVSDQPESNNGFDEGMTPPELLLASLGTCAGYYAVDYLKRNHLSLEGVQVRVTAEKAKNPARLDDFKIEVEAPAGLSEEHIKGVEEAVHRCLIHNTLRHPPKIETVIKRTQGAAK
ncbi:MAG: OsmC family protein [Acidobacteriota bacterium]|nr:OsmC family protein [Acidobacteriota bacterium]